MQVLHSSEFVGAGGFRGQNAIVFGVGNSGSDIAQDLQRPAATGDHGAARLDHGGQPNPASLVIFSLYRQGWPTEVCDLINIANPGPAAIESLRP